MDKDKAILAADRLLDLAASVRRQATLKRNARPVFNPAYYVLCETAIDLEMKAYWLMRDIGISNQFTY